LSICEVQNLCCIKLKFVYQNISKIRKGFFLFFRGEKAGIMILEVFCKQEYLILC
jgi:hypothetical protein